MAPPADGGTGADAGASTAVAPEVRPPAPVTDAGASPNPAPPACVALLYSKSPDLPADHNIAFDSQKNVVSVNNGFLEVCRPWTYSGVKAGVPLVRPFTCNFGTSELLGTGFDHFAATGWLRTRSNIVPGEELTIRFAIWDGADEALDSTVLIDNFTWAATSGTTVTDRPPPVL